MPDTAKAEPPWIRRRPTQIGFILLLLLGWTLLANQWSSKGCDLMPQSYGLVITHGTPDHYEGCESEPGGPAYTDNYRD